MAKRLELELKSEEGGGGWEREKVVNGPQGTCELLHEVQMDNAYSQPPKFSLPSFLIKNSEPWWEIRANYLKILVANDKYSVK